jgi:fructokinase
VNIGQSGLAAATGAPRGLRVDPRLRKLRIRNTRLESSGRSKMTAAYRIGVDLGGTKIEGAAVDAAGAVRGRRRQPTPVDDYGATIAAIAAIVLAIERDLGAPAAVGIGIPGAISPASGLVKNANSTWLNGRPLQTDLAAALDRPVRLANDANCFALSESVDGAAAGMDSVFGVILGTGVGGGIAIRGKILGGVNAIAGEWGHNSLPWPTSREIPGQPCHCGRTGCVETFLSGPGLSADHRREAGYCLPPREIVRRAAAGERDCHATLRRYMERLARGLAAVINIVDPDAIVLGGGLSRIDALYDEVPILWAPYVFSDRVATRLLRPVHGDSSGVRGAAWLWPSEGGT